MRHISERRRVGSVGFRLGRSGRVLGSEVARERRSRA